MDSTAYGDMFQMGSDGAALVPAWRGALLARPAGDDGSVMVDLLAAVQALTEPENTPVMGGRCPCCDSSRRLLRVPVDDGDGPQWCDHEWHDGLDGPFAGWLLVPPPAELPDQDWLVLSPSGHLAVGLDLAEDLEAAWLQQSDDGPEAR